MVICKYCGREFDRKRVPTRHIEICEGYLSFTKKKELEKKSKSYNYQCYACGSVHETEKSLLCHKARCKKHKEIKEKFIKQYIDYILSEIVYRSAHSISRELSKINENISVTHGDITEILKTNNIKPRSISEGTSLESSQKQKAETCLNRYGDTHSLGKNSSCFLKRNQTVLEKYNVKNVFQIEEIKNNINSDELYLERYNKTRKEFKSDIGKKVWTSYTEEERRKRSLLAAKNAKINFEKRTGRSYSDFQSEIQVRRWENTSDEEKQKIVQKVIKTKIENGSFSIKRSSIEILIEEILNSIGVDYRIQWFIHNKNSDIKFYDFLIPNKKILIEVNGDFWHANPLIYNNTDLLSFPGGLVIAEDIWQKDYEKHKIAIDNNFNIIYIWEKDIKNNINGVISFLMEVIL